MDRDFGNFAGRYQQYSRKADPRARGAKVVIKNFAPLEDKLARKAKENDSSSSKHPASELVSLFQDIQNYKKGLEEQLEKYSFEKLSKQEHFKLKLEEFNALSNEIRIIARENGVDLEGKTPNAVSHEEEKAIIDELSKVSASKPAEQSNEETIYLAQEVTPEDCQVMSKRLDAIERKVQLINSKIGDKEVFRGKPIGQSFAEETDVISMLDPVVAGDLVRKLEIIAENIEKEAKERRSNYFSSVQKEQLAQFFENFAGSDSSFLNGSEPNHVALAVEALEANQLILNNACLFLKEIRNLSERLEEILRDSTENQTILTDLKTSIEENMLRISENLKIISRA